MKKIFGYVFIFLSLFLISSCDSKNDNVNDNKDKNENINNNDDNKENEDKKEEDNPNTPVVVDNTNVKKFESKDGIIIEFKGENSYDSKYELIINYNINEDNLNSYKSKINDEKEEAILIFDFDLKLNEEYLDVNDNFNVKFPISIIKEYYSSFDETKLNNYHLYLDNDGFKKIDMKLDEDYISFNSNLFDTFVLSFNPYTWTPIIWQ